MTTIRGWHWLLMGVIVQLLWLHLVSMRAHIPALLSWLPCLGLVPGVGFLWLNRGRRGLWVMAVGGGLNGLVMVANGGLMPLAPTALPHLTAAHRVTAQAVAHTKDRLLSDRRTRMALLDDRLVSTVGDLRIAASLGDALVAIGVLITLGEEVWAAGYLWRRVPRPT